MAKLSGTERNHKGGHCRKQESPERQNEVLEIGCLPSVRESYYVPLRKSPDSVRISCRTIYPIDRGFQFQGASHGNHENHEQRKQQYHP